MLDVHEKVKYLSSDLYIKRQICVLSVLVKFYNEDIKKIIEKIKAITKLNNMDSISDSRLEQVEQKIKETFGVQQESLDSLNISGISNISNVSDVDINYVEIDFDQVEQKATKQEKIKDLIYQITGVSVFKTPHIAFFYANFLKLQIFQEVDFSYDISRLLDNVNQVEEPLSTSPLEQSKGYDPNANLFTEYFSNHSEVDEEVFDSFERLLLADQKAGCSINNVKEDIRDKAFSSLIKILNDKINADSKLLRRNLSRSKKSKIQVRGNKEYELENELLDLRFNLKAQEAKAEEANHQAKESQEQLEGQLASKAKDQEKVLKEAKIKVAKHQRKVENIDKNSIIVTLVILIVIARFEMLTPIVALIVGLVLSIFNLSYKNNLNKELIKEIRRCELSPNDLIQDLSVVDVLAYPRPFGNRGDKATAIVEKDVFAQYNT